MKRKAKTALVHNPSRRLTIGGARKANPVRRKRRASTRRRRRNPVIRAVARRRNPIRRRSNPASLSGLLVAAIMTGAGVSIFDLIATRIAPQNSALVRTGFKLGGAYFFQTWGSKVPVLGKYKNDIALVLAVSGVVDLMKLYLFPVVVSTAQSIGLMGGGGMLALGEGDGTTGSIYGNAGNPAWVGYN